VVTIQEKHTTSLSCEAEGLPLPDVTWVRLYGSLPGGRHVIHNNGTLIISGILQQDAGMYVCQAKNVLGMAKSTNLLIVHGMGNAFVLVLHSLPSSINKKLYFHLENYLRQTAPQESGALYELPLEKSHWHLGFIYSPNSKNHFLQHY